MLLSSVKLVLVFINLFNRLFFYVVSFYNSHKILKVLVNFLGAFRTYFLHGATFSKMEYCMPIYFESNFIGLAFSKHKIAD